MAICALKNVYKAQQHARTLVITPDFLFCPARLMGYELHPPIARTLKNLDNFELWSQAAAV
jgi:hypothetical protein